MNYYHPTTLEHIRNPLPAVKDWAKSTAVAVPDYDPATQQCRFVDGAWAVETPASDPAARIAEIKVELVSLDQKRIRPLAEGDAEYLAVLNGQVLTLRAELKSISESI